MSEIGCPDVVLIAWQIGKEQIGEYTAIYLRFSIFLAVSPVGLDAVLVHHPKDALLVKGQVTS